MAGPPPDDRQDASNSPPNDGRDPLTAALAVACVVGLVAAGTVVPALAAPLSGDSFNESLFDQSGGDGGGPSTPSGGVPGGTGAASAGLGALNPGDSTSVGGSLGGASLRNQSAETHFYVESDQPAYWRTGAYDMYTGEGWAVGQGEFFDAARSNRGGYRLEQTVELERPATALPAAWRPIDIDTDARVSVQRYGIAADEPLAAGSEYTVTSYRRNPDPELLRRTGTPTGSEQLERYTRMPDSTPDRVGEFTSELTANDATAYDKAATIERWLEENKDYSLDASHDTSGDVADQFIFEMDEGYCEYYATAMTAMLRTQDIPARYVVGYSQGQPVDENRYEVRGMNAHAWVEVYFEDVGWVKFDPTPAADRQTVQQQAVENRTGDGEDYPHEVQTSPGETYDPSNGTLTNAEPPYSIDLGDDPAPGRDVTVSVTKAGRPVEGVVVSFNGEPVGRTDSAGQVVGTVPYTDSLNVTVRPVEVATRESGPAGLTVTDSAALAGAGERSGGFAFGAPPAQEAPADGNGTRTYDVDTTVSVRVAGTPTPGATVDLLVRAGGEPFRNATVRIDGETVGRTDEAGTFTTTLRGEAGDEVTVAVERGDVAGERTISLGELDASVDGLAVAGRNATVVVTVGDDPVSNATVAINGETVGRTDGDGELSVPLPLANSATVTASVDGRTTETALDGLLLPVAAAGVALVAALSGAVALARRRGVTVDDVAARLRWVAGGFVAVLVALGDGLDGLARLVQRAVERFDGFRRLRAALAGLTLGGVVARLRALVRQLLGRVGIGGGPRPEPTDRTEVVERATAPEDVSEERRSLRALWRRFVGLVSPGDNRTRTPGDVARAAVRKGFPDEPVYRLTNAFRRAEYGEDRPDEERLSAARRALDALRNRGEDR
ncbi:transglutaminase domain-containing protein [Halostella litorea]|uniref:transglutaminase domain-containing protein n=1 Tax=Halostella litorea TaxID=2528831 RepID=UPI00109242F8|nr:transglutaminase domain-containing protein [Halostella litorea]